MVDLSMASPVNVITRWYKKALTCLICRTRWEAMVPRLQGCCDTVLLQLSVVVNAKPTRNCFETTRKMDSPQISTWIPWKVQNFPGNYPLPRLFQGFLLQRVGVSPNCDVRPLPSFVSGLWLSDLTIGNVTRDDGFSQNRGATPRWVWFLIQELWWCFPFKETKKTTDYSNYINHHDESLYFTQIHGNSTAKSHTLLVLDPKVEKRVVKSSFVISNAARTPYLLLFSSWLRPRRQTAAVAPCSNGNVAIRPNSTGTIQPSPDATFFA